MIKVFINPNYGDKPDRADGGIRRVVEAQKKHLPDFGIEVVDHPEEADVINNHGASLMSFPGIPSINTCHGFMWSKYDWDKWAHKVNSMVVESMSHAVTHTAPSKWVARAMTRGMMVDPTVIYHGVDADEWDHTKEKQDYVLWNKARKDNVSDPVDMNLVAELLPNIKFISTIGNEQDNVKITGAMPFPDMKLFIETAGIYLATARETFGIGTLEAMICGVPVVGWDWGGQSEIIKHEETGYLAEPGDFKDLAYGIKRVMENKEKLGRNARGDALQNWGWKKRIKQYANVYKEVYNEYNQERPKVSVIVTSYDLAHYLSDALESVRKQTLEDFECIIVDDYSSDNTHEVASRFTDDPRFKYVKPDKNLGLSLARNFGVSRSRGQYIIMLDADDMLEHNALKILSEALDKDWAIHVAYGHLDTFTDKDRTPKRNPWPTKQFSWRQQMAHMNQLPYSSMMRRFVFERSCGYRGRHWRAEDAAFWCRISSFGFRIKKVTQASTLIYRMRGDSKSNRESSDGDWTAWYPWRIAGDPRKGSEKIREDYQPPQYMIPWGAPPEENLKEGFWHIPDVESPGITVIIPVGPGHGDVVIDAAESVMAQAYRNWQLVIVNDTGEPLDIPCLSYAEFLDTPGKKGPSYARNMGARQARADKLLWLDADDYLMPNALQEMVEVYNANAPCIVYSDWLKNVNDITETMKYYETEEFECGRVLGKLRHSVTCLIPTRYHRAIGGFDKEIDGWEDWDYYIALQDQGLCSYRVPEALFVYRFYGGERREDSFGKRKYLLQYIRDKWSKYYEREEDMPCGGCGGKKRSAPAVDRQVEIPKSSKVVDGYQMVILEYTGKMQGPFRVNGKAPTHSRYKFGLNQSSKFSYVYPHDVKYLLGKRSKRDGSPLFRVVKSESEPEEQVKPEDFVNQEIESEPEKVESEPFMLDIHMDELTVADLRKVLREERYLKLGILESLYEQEINGKDRKTSKMLLRREIDKLA